MTDENESIFNSAPKAFKAVLDKDCILDKAHLTLYDAAITIAAAEAGDEAHLIFTADDGHEKTGFRYTDNGSESRVYHNRVTGWSLWEKQTEEEALKEMAFRINDRKGKQPR